MRSTLIGSTGEAMPKTSLVNIDAWRSSRQPKLADKLPTKPLTDALSSGAWENDVLMFWRAARNYAEGKRRGDMAAIAEAADELEVTRMHSEHARLRARCDEVLSASRRERGKAISSPAPNVGC